MSGKGHSELLAIRVILANFRCPYDDRGPQKGRECEEAASDGDAMRRNMEDGELDLLAGQQLGVSALTVAGPPGRSA